MNVRQYYSDVRWHAYWKHCRLPEIEVSDFISKVRYTEPPIKEKLYMPPYMGSAECNDYIPLLNLVERIDPKIVLELGTAYGSTVANICAISQAKVYTVNALPEQIEGFMTTAVLSIDEIGYVYREHGFDNRVVQIYENTKKLELTHYLPLGSVDLAIIDACHDPDFVLNDFMKLLPLLKGNGVVLLHDVHPSMRLHLMDSYLACMYLRKMGFDIRHIQGSWWGYWRASSQKIKFSMVTAMYFQLDQLINVLLKRSPTMDVWSYKYLAKKKLNALP